MKRYLQFAAVVLSLFTFAFPVVSSVRAQTPPGKTAPKKSVTVWVNLPSGVYHYPGTRWYGKTKSGKFMTEAEAKAAGYKASQSD